MPRTSRPASAPVLAIAVAGLVLAAGSAWRLAGGDERQKRAMPSARVDSVREFRLKDLDGKEHGLAEHRDAKAVVLAWTAAGCPVSKVYAPRLAAGAKAWAARGVVFYGVSSDDGASVDELRAQTAAAGATYPVLLDADGALAQRVGAKTSAAVAVLDAHRRVRYLGAVDDQYGVGGRREAPTKRWLEDALEAVLGAKPVAVERTDAPGCPITFRAAPAPSAGGTAPTWSGEVAKIVHGRCASCHRPDEAAPFSLRTYDDVRGRTATIRAAVAEERMPPWHAVGERGTWLNDRRLAPDEKAAVLRWIDAGAPEGDAARAPAPPPLPPKDAWEMGTPDAVFAFPAPEAVPAEGSVPYRYVRVPTDFPEDRWVVATEVRPGAPDVVHHALVAAVTPGRKKVNGAFEPTQGFFSAMVPGGRVQRFPEGTAKRLPKGHELVFQMHYTPNGVATTDVTRVGFRFGPKPEREVRTLGIYNHELRIPPGEPAWEVSRNLPVPFNGRILAFMPHMHLRGSAFRYVLKTPEGEERVVCDVPRFDFNWQTPARCATPIVVKKGSWLKATGTFDNSAKNAYNPDPTAEVRWGDQTWEEMMIGYVDFVIDP